MLKPTQRPGHEGPDTSSRAMAYLVSEYPGISHTFILREALRLRDAGFRLDVASINPPKGGGAWMTPDEQKEAAATYYVKPHGLIGALGGLLHGITRPVALLRTLLLALRLSGGHPREIVMNLFYVTEALMISRWMHQRRHTHLHVHFATAAAKVGLLVKHFADVGLSMTVHGPDEFYNAPGEWLKKKIEAADFVVCISRFARSQVMKLSGGEHWRKFHVCPLGVDVAHFTPEPQMPPAEPFTILCVGRLTPAKGQRILLAAARRLHAAGRNFKLVVVGDGPDAADLHAVVKARALEACVEFTGALNQHQVRERYRQAHAFALASFAEGVPVVLMEAMACAIPCVTTRITGIPELIEHEESGLLVAPSDDVELASALGRLMDDPAYARRLGLAGRERVQARYNLVRNVDRLAQVFECELARRTHHSAAAVPAYAPAATLREGLQ